MNNKIKSVREYVEALRQIPLFAVYAPFIRRSVLDNAPGSFERFYYFVIVKMPITFGLRVPDDFFTAEQKKYFSDVYLLRKQNPEFDKKFVMRFKKGAIGDAVYKSLNTIIEYFDTL